MTDLFPQLCSFDLETTGPDPNVDHIVTASALLMSRDGTIESRDFLADPGIEISEGAQGVHGISNEYARAHGRPHDDVLADVIGLLNWAWGHGIPVVAFNASFDLSLLKTRDPHFQIGGLVLDPHVIDKFVDKYRRGSRKLVATAAHYKVSLTEDEAHGSGADARAGGEIIWKQFTRGGPHNVLGDSRVAAALSDPQDLMKLQADQRRETQAGLAQYLLRSGKIDSVDEVDGGWPLQDSTLAALD
ncbi:exonuclease domain-containing protein [Corynebacterium sp. AOP12-C2-36]|uniref:exonuclease domain-containing protein n=1 Tax=Corynebacterium sp. AOP12-C2-36 TaxID=3457723 RepID=UPI0040349E22